MSRSQLVAAAGRTRGAWASIWPALASLKSPACGRSYFRDTLRIPNLGIHFGRARGPELNSVSLGLYLTACCLCTWMLFHDAGGDGNNWCCWPHATDGLRRAADIHAFDLDRLRREWARSRRVSNSAPLAVGLPVAGVLLVGCALCCSLGPADGHSSAKARPEILSTRSTSAHHSPTCPGKCFATIRFSASASDASTIASCRIFPIARQTIELESIRGLHHHNTILSVLTETGLVGLAAFVAVFLAWVRCAGGSRSTRRLALGSRKAC